MGVALTSSISPADFALIGSKVFPSSRNSDAPNIPNFRTNLVVPPAPGKIPTLISGKPIFALSLFAAKIRWVQSGISKPIPRAVPGRTVTIGLPPLLVLGSIPARSILRIIECICIKPSNKPLAGLSPFNFFKSAKTLRSIPAAKSGLALVITAPIMFSSSKILSIRLSKSLIASKFKILKGFWGQSHIMVAIRSGSIFNEKSAIFYTLYPLNNCCCAHS